MVPFKDSVYKNLNDIPLIQDSPYGNLSHGIYSSHLHKDGCTQMFTVELLVITEY